MTFLTSRLYANTTGTPLLLNPLSRRVEMRSGLPVLPGAFPVVGHLPAMMTDPLTLARHAEKTLGPVVWMQPGFGRWLLMCLGTDSIEIFRNQQTSSDSMQKLAGEFFGLSMIGQDGKPHRSQRSALNAAFSFRGLDTAQVGAGFLELITRHVQGWIEAGSVQLLPRSRDLILGLMFSMLGAHNTDLTAWREDYEDALLLLVNMPDVPFSPRRKGRAGKERLDRKIRALIAKVRHEEDSTGLLSQMVRGRDENGELLDDQLLVDNLRLLLAAGHETTASVIAWMMAYLAARPDVWEWVVEEAMDAQGPPGSPTEMKRFVRAEGLFREALRMHPPVVQDARRALKDFELCGRTIPADVNVTLSVMHLARHPDVYTDPDAFIPSRWVGKSGVPSALEIIEFGAGPHFCLGYHVAWMESVQLAVVFARELASRGLRPVLRGPMPTPRYVPLAHPEASARVWFER